MTNDRGRHDRDRDRDCVCDDDPGPTLYLVSMLPATLPESMLELPPVVNSTPVAVLVFTWGGKE